MKQRLRARELWLLAPFLLIGALAFYWQRAEQRGDQIGAPLARAMVVSDVKIEAAPGYYQSQGYSHRVTVKVSHPWPRPKWWGQNYPVGTLIDPLKPGQAIAASRLYTPAQHKAKGETLTFVRGGKQREVPAKYLGRYYDFRFDGTDYISVNYFGLSALPADWGAIQLHGLYRLGAQHQVGFEREIRRAGETLNVVPDKNPGARLARVYASDFHTIQEGVMGAKPIVQDQCSVLFAVDQFQPPLVAGEQVGVALHDLELQDATGKTFDVNSTPGLDTTWSFGVIDSDNPPRAEEKNVVVSFEFAPTLATRGRLRLRGTVSVGDRWPIPFEVTLPPRVIRAPKEGGNGALSNPLEVRLPPRAPATPPTPATSHAP